MIVELLYIFLSVTFYNFQTPNETSMSVKDQIKQLNRMQSTTDVLNTTAQPNSTEDNNKINNNNNKVTCIKYIYCR